MASRPESTVAPVVVKPEMVSKTASTKRTCGLLDSMKGSAPISDSKNQNATTTTKPSRLRKSGLCRHTGSQHSKPKPSIVSMASKNGITTLVPSYHHATAIGGSMVKLNMIIRRPTMYSAVFSGERRLLTRQVFQSIAARPAGRGAAATASAASQAPSAADPFAPGRSKSASLIVRPETPAS